VTASLAYAVGIGERPQRWNLRVYANGRTRTVGVARGRALSVGGPRTNRSFDWSPQEDSLAFFDGQVLYAVRGNELVELSDASEIADIRSTSSRRGFGTYERYVRFSPSGRFIAVGLGGAVGVFTADGGLTRVFPAIFRAWSGDSALLAVGLENGAPSLFLYPVEDGGARIVEKGFKGGIVLNPSDRWVAYAEGESGRKEVIFRGTDGSALARVALPFRPVVVGSLSTAGKFSTVAWP
jgi:hypothetical protein